MNRKALIKAAEEKHIEHDAITAGRQAEDLVGAYLIDQLKGPLRKTLIWHDIRIPRPDGKGRYEIDFLLASPYGILLLEVKNFGGSLAIDPKSGHWLQTTSTQTKKVHDNPIDHTAKKAEALRAFLQQKNIPCHPQNIQLRIVQANPRVVLSLELAKHSQVCRLKELNTAFKFLLPSKPGWLSLGRSPAAFKRFGYLEKQLELLPTWDEIQLHGGKILRGDILKSYGAKLPSRDQVTALRLLIPRHPFWGRLHPSMAFYSLRLAGIIPLPWFKMIRADERLKIQCAGEAQVKEISLYMIKSIQFGSHLT